MKAEHLAYVVLGLVAGAAIIIAGITITLAFKG